MKRIITILLLSGLSVFAQDFLTTLTLTTNEGETITETRSSISVPAGYVLRRKTNDTGFEAVPPSVIASGNSGTNGTNGTNGVNGLPGSDALATTSATLLISGTLDAARLPFAMQPTNGNLTLWTAFAPSAKQDALGYVPQISNATLTAWAAIATTAKEDTGVVSNAMLTAMASKDVATSNTLVTTITANDTTTSNALVTSINTKQATLTYQPATNAVNLVATNHYFLTNTWSITAITNGRPAIGMAIASSNNIALVAVRWSNGVVLLKNLLP